MLKRKIDQMLQEWKDNPDRKALRICGARQVGKTTSVENFGKQYDSFININFIKEEDKREIFSGDLDPAVLRQIISFQYPHLKCESGKTLLFLDEIQTCPRALESMKFWTQDAQWDVIASGSEQGIDYHTSDYSFPVGQISFIDMNSLDFEEFLWAMGITEEQVQYVHNLFKKRKPVPVSIHRKLMEYLSLYMILGGMPQLVQNYVLKNDLQEADQLQREIYRSYLADIAHYAKADIAHYAKTDIRIKAEACYRSVPDQLSKDNHKFQYSKVEKNGSARKFDSSLDWLLASRLITRVYNVKDIQFPLRAMKIEEDFRIYPTDIGMLMAAFPVQLKTALLQDHEMEKKSENLLLRSSKGALYEALAAEMLYKRGYEEGYFFKPKNRNMEIEFLIESDDGPVPVEIKAGRSRSRSLDELLKTEKIQTGFKAGSYNCGQTGKKITIPLYMLMFL